ncbi:branched-chain amino acid ABC transporter permease [Desulfosporosinus sp. BG]|uniref:branched-chain amino acid ABC transporter permease n=1 Tax=Desulfosporosinus sp. BG TaxID=1633135 RepID=UPI000839F4BC|nr:branched-chain amino acid ABC transporter permease [Desulfosporosinus sp. BG]ODA40466.1 Branched-chain amino acid transport system permease protein LivM [Desulfosporosinus sp. BG]
MDSILNPYYLGIVVIVGIYVILALGLNIVTGFAGQVSLGHAAFYAIGAYTSAILSLQGHLIFWLALPAAAIVTWCTGIVLGLPSLRVKEDFLAIVTLGLGLIIQSLANNLKITGGALGLGSIPQPELFGEPMSNFSFAVMTWLFVALAAFVAWRALNSRVGRAWLAIREDELVADALGVNTTRLKVLAFALGALYAGVAGSLFAHYTTFISADSFGFNESATILSMIVLGGLGSIPGAITGAILLALAPEVLRPLADYRMLIYGLLLVILMRYRPQGLFGRSKAIRDRYAKKWLKKGGPKHEAAGNQKTH